MKKIVFFMFLNFFYFSLEATPTGNPATPKIIQEGIIFSSAKSFGVKLGYEGNFVVDKRLIQADGILKRVDDFSFSMNSAVLTFNFVNRLDLYGTYGIGRIEADWLINDGPDVLYYLDLQTKYDWSYSLGTKVIFFEWGNVSLSAGGRYFYFRPTISYFSKVANVFHLSETKMKFWEWQADIGLSYNINIFTPYICAKYSKAKASFSIPDVIISSNGSSKQTFKNKNDFGMALGCSFSNGKYFLLNVEVRLIDEEAFTVSGEFKF